MNTLQKTLLPNGVLSFLSGVAIALANEGLATIFSSQHNEIFVGLGAVLAAFGLLVLGVAVASNTTGTLLVFLLDSIWVLATLVVLLFRPFELAPAARWITALYGLPVLAFVWFQGHVLHALDRKAQGGPKTLHFEREVAAAPAEVWPVISDVANYHRVAPNIDRVEILSGSGRGQVRRCAHAGQQWTETCTLWREGEAFAFRVDTAAADYPYPFASLSGHWEVQPAAAGSANLKMTFSFRYKHVFQSVLLHPLLRRRFAKIAGQLLDNWQQQLEKR
mgnify:CR=1 FL=1